MSRRCPGHVLRTGTCQKIPGTESDGRPHFWQNFFSHVSITCPQSKSHVQLSKKKQRKRESESIKSSKFSFGRLIWFHSKKILLKFFLCNYKLIIDSKIEKNGGINKRFASRTQIMCRKAHFISLPLVPPLIRDKIHFFIFSFFIQNLIS